MRRNVSGQYVGVQLVSATDGSAVTSGTTTVYVTGDAGTQAAGSVGSGACTHEGNGYWTYAPAQAETNYTHVAFTFTNTSAVNATLQIYPTAYDASGRVDVGAVGGTAQTAGDLAALITTVDTVVDSILADTGTDGVVVAAGSKTGYSLTATTGLGNQTADITGSLSGSVGSVTGAVGSVTGNVGGNVTGSVGSVAAGGITASSIAADAIGASELAADAVAEIADAIWDEARSGHTTGGTYGEMVSLLKDQIEFQRGHHTVSGSTFYVDGTAGNDTTGNGSRALPYATITKALTVCTANAHDQIILLPNSGGGPTTITESATITISKGYVQIRGPGRDVAVTNSSSSTVFDVQASGVGLSGMRVTTGGGATSSGVYINGGVDFVRLERLWIESAHQDAVRINVANRCEIIDCKLISAARDGVRVDSGVGSGQFTTVRDCVIRGNTGSGVNLQGSDAANCRVTHNVIRDNGTGLTVAAGANNTVFTDNRLANNSTAISDSGTGTLLQWNYFATDTSGNITGMAAGTITAAAVATGAIDADALAADAVAEIADGVWDEAIAGHLGAGSTGEALNGASAPTAAAVADAVWDEALSGHAIAGSAGEALSAAGTAGDPWTTAIPGAYGAGTAGYILGNNIDAAVSSRSSQTSVDTIDDFLDTEVAAILADTNELQTDWVNGGRLDLLIDAIKAKTDNLPAAPAATSDIPTAAAVADAVWDEATVGHTTAGTFGEQVKTDIDAILTDTDVIGAAGAGLTAVPWNAAWDAEVQSEVQDALEANNLDHLVGTATGIPAVVAGTYLDQIMDDGTATYDRTTDSLQAVRDRGDAAWATATGFSTLDAAGIRTAVGLASANLDTQLDALPTTAEVNAEVDTALADVGLTPTVTGRIDAAVSTRATPAQVATEIADALATDGYPEPGQGTPPATTTLAAKINYLYKAWRNRTTQSATQYSLYADDATTIDQKAAVSDDTTTFDRGEVATGP